MGVVDLHMHSVHSDGSMEPIELIKMGKEKGLKIMALTDHDNIEGSKEFIKYNDQGIYLYSGVELTAKASKGRMHILGYNIDLDNKKLNDVLMKMKEASIYNFLLYVELLRKDYNLNIPQEKIEQIIKSKGNIGRPHLAKVLIEEKYCQNVDEAFDRFLSPVYEKARKVKKGLTEEECVTLIKEAGGIVSLAHPSSLKMDNDELEKEIIYLKSLGLDSIEVIHINNSKENRLFYHYLAQKYNLLESGGSDFHGIEVKPDVLMGTGRNGNVDIGVKTLSLTRKVKSRYMER